MAAILVLSPVLLYAITLLLPTFDDWTYTTTPQSDGFTVAALLPSGSYWRPFDTIFGHILGLDYRMFPTLNHIAVYAGHVGNTYLVYKLFETLAFGRVSRNMATIFFFISPAMLGTVLGIDSLNQTYSQLWGLLGLWLYLRHDGKAGRTSWIVCAWLAVLSKENGIAFFIIPPVLAFGFGRISLPRLRKDIITATVCSAAYFALRMLLTTRQAEISGEYLTSPVAERLKDVATFIGMTWIPIDYVSLVHKPSRNIAIVVSTFVLSVPFVVYLFLSCRRYLARRPFVTLAACVVAAALPHLATLFSAMHAYSGLSMSALIVAYLADRLTARQRTASNMLFALFAVSCLFTDWHHWQKSYESGLTGKRMAEDIISQTGLNKPQKAYIIIVDDGYPKYSSFCVIPTESAGWGIAVKYHTGYSWPKELTDTTINRSDTDIIPQLTARAGAMGYDAVWLFEDSGASVIK